MTRIQSTRPYPTPLPPGTIVYRPEGRIGVVQNYQPHALPARMGTFPVRWYDGQWETCGPADVTIAASSAS